MEQRYVFYVSVGANLTAKVRAARKTVRAMGAKVVKTGAGTMLVEATPAAAADMEGALPEWRYAIESKSTEIPEQGPLKRTRLKLG